MHELVLRNIKVELGKKIINENINLNVESGEMISLLGASGCGKSTLLKTIAGLIEPTAGEILIDGKNVKSFPPEKRGTVIVFQDLRLFPNMNVIENVEFGLKMKGINKDDRKEKSKIMLEKVGLEGYEKRKVYELSGGQKQRVALARAIASEPEILLLDEPFSSLDENLRYKMRNLVMKLQREMGITTIMVTHDKEEALLMSNRIAMMINGKIVQYDKAKEVYNNPCSREVADYFGDMNYIEGVCKNGVFTSKIGTYNTSLKDGKYTLMIKPKDIKILDIDKKSESKILNVKYLGDKYSLVVSYKDIELIVETYREYDFVIGQNVRIEVSTEKAIFYMI